MFQRTLRRLSAMNSIVFLIIFMVFGTVIYGYISYRLFDKVDDAMRLKATNFRIVNGRIIPQSRNRFLFDPRVIIMLRDVNGGTVNIFYTDDNDITRLSELVEDQKPDDRIVTKEFENHSYRVITFPYPFEDNLLMTDRGPIAINGIIAITLVDSEVASLRHLLIIIASGMITGVLIIILAGYYLAKRAMVPIQKSWDRQQQFVADASHELRTPLAVVKSNAELMLRHPDHTIEEESIRVTNIARETRRMTKLVSDLLTLARSDANQSELKLSLVSVNELINAVAEQFVPLAEMEGITLQAEISEQLELTADRERLHQLLVILLDNAIKYTLPPGKIFITATKHGGNISVAVEDSGQGIPPEDLQRVFDRFFRSDKARSREKGGTGLGLAIAKWIIDKHGGKITVESKLGSGTKFSIMLPVKRVF
ncbi:Adaptive-response sensory-kinase SasA [Sporomusa rhizae]|uniref:sensor histidine kinase n=1 Tax=Sporomusa rhizae TaxID=357999 RepID=UPI00352B7069